MEQLTSPSKIICGTLGPSGTSSENAAIHFVSRYSSLRDIVLYDSFSAVRRALLQKVIQCAIVPNAYPDIHRFYIHPHIYLQDQFVWDTPAYGLATLPDALPITTELKIATHAVTKHLVKYFLPTMGREATCVIETVRATSVAALRVQQKKADFAITNRIAAERYGLITVKTYGPIRMGWSVFTYR